MDQMTMLDNAEKLAIDTLWDCMWLDKETYNKLKRLPKDKAIRQLAHQFLEDATDSIYP